METKVILCDKKDEVVEAWQTRFLKNTEIDIVAGDIFDCGCHAVVIPGNSFGFLDRGLEFQAGELFGFELQDIIRSRIREGYSGELLVGQGFTIPCEDQFGPDSACKYLVYVSVSRTPQDIKGTLNAYLAARGAFLAISEPGLEDIESIALPGIGTGSSGMPPEICARQMRYAYSIFAGRRGYGDKNLTRLTRREQKLRRMPKPSLEETPADESGQQES